MSGRGRSLAGPYKDNGGRPRKLRSFETSRLTRQVPLFSGHPKLRAQPMVRNYKPLSRSKLFTFVQGRPNRLSCMLPFWDRSFAGTDGVAGRRVDVAVVQILRRTSRTAGFSMDVAYINRAEVTHRSVFRTKPPRKNEAVRPTITVAQRVERCCAQLNSQNCAAMRCCLLWQD